MVLVFSNSRLLYTTELRLSTNLGECSALIYALCENEFLIQGSQHLLFYTLTTRLHFVHTEEQTKSLSLQVLNPLMIFPNLHIVRTEGKNLSLPDLLSRLITTTTQDEQCLRTIEVPDSIKF